MKKVLQPELPIDTTAGATTAPAVEEIAAVDLIDDAPDVITSDLRKFNKTRQTIAKALAPLRLILKIQDAAGVASAMEHMKTASRVEKAIENKRHDLVRPYNNEVARINKYAKELSEDVPKELNRVKGLLLIYDKEQKAEAQKKRTNARHQVLLNLGLVFMDKGADQVKSPHYADAITSAYFLRVDLEDSSDEIFHAWLNSLALRRQEKRDERVGELQQEKAAHEFFGDDGAAAEVDTKIAQLQQAPARTLAYSTGSFAPTKTQGLTKRWTFKVTNEAAVPRAYLVIDEKKIKAEIATGTRFIPGLEIYQDESISLR